MANPQQKPPAKADAKPEIKLKKVIATEPGYHKRYINPGDVFQIEEHHTGSWFKDYKPGMTVEAPVDINRALAAPGSTKSSTPVAPGSPEQVAREVKNDPDLIEEGDDADLV